MTVEDDDSFFYFRLMSLIAFECRTPAAAVLGASNTLLHGYDDERREDLLELIRMDSERLCSNLKMLTLASKTALGVLDRRNVPTVNSRQIADQACASSTARGLASWAHLDEDAAATVRVTGEGVAVLAEETVEAGLAIIVQRIVHHQPGLNVTVDGAEITVGPVPANDDVRRFVIGDDQETGIVGLAVRVIRALGGSVDLDGDTLIFRFPEPPSLDATL